MEISKMTSCSDEDFKQIEALVGVLSSSCKADRAVLEEVIAQENTHLFVARDKEKGIVGMATALKDAVENMEENTAKLNALREKLGQQEST